MDKSFTAFIPLMPAELAPLGQAMLQMIGYSVLIVIAGIFTAVFEEAVEARIQMRPRRSLKYFFARIFNLLIKEPVFPKRARRRLFLIAPIFAFIFSLFFFMFLSINENAVFRSQIGVLYLLFAVSVGAYTFVTGGWNNGSWNGFFGAVRMLAQTLSCQIIFAVIVMIIIMTAGSADLYEITQAQRGLWYIFPHFPMFVLFMICCLMALARPPFGSPKSRRDLASGIFGEYSGTLLLLFMGAEYIFLLLAATSTAVLFLGGSLPVFGLNVVPGGIWLFLKTLTVLFIFAWIKAALPTYRSDKLMENSFKLFLPFALGWVVLTASVILLRQGGLA